MNLDKHFSNLIHFNSKHIEFHGMPLLVLMPFCTCFCVSMPLCMDASMFMPLCIYAFMDPNPNNNVLK